MREFVTSGNLTLLALLVLTLEALLLFALRGRLRGRPPAIDILAMALPGACLLLALYCAQAASGWWTSTLALGIALPAHLADVARRWRPGTRA